MVRTVCLAVLLASPARADDIEALFHRTLSDSELLHQRVRKLDDAARSVEGETAEVILASFADAAALVDSLHRLEGRWDTLAVRGKGSNVDIDAFEAEGTKALGKARQGLVEIVGLVGSSSSSALLERARAVKSPEEREGIEAMITLASSLMVTVGDLAPPQTGDLIARAGLVAAMRAGDLDVTEARARACLQACTTPEARAEAHLGLALVATRGAQKDKKLGSSECRAAAGDSAGTEDEGWVADRCDAIVGKSWRK